MYQQVQYETNILTIYLFYNCYMLQNNIGFVSDKRWRRVVAAN